MVTTEVAGCPQAVPRTFGEGGLAGQCGKSSGTFGWQLKVISESTDWSLARPSTQWAPGVCGRADSSPLTQATLLPHPHGLGAPYTRQQPVGWSVLCRVTSLAVFLCVCPSYRFSREQSEGQFERPCLLQPPRRGCQGQGVPSGPDRPPVTQRRPEPRGQSKQGAQELELRGTWPCPAGIPGQGCCFAAELGRWVGQPRG